MQHPPHTHQRISGRALSVLTGTVCLALATPGYAVPFVSAGADVVGLNGRINNEALNVHAPSVSKTNSINQSSARGSTTVASSAATASGSGALKVFGQVSATTVAPDFPASWADATALAVMGDTVNFAPGTYSIAITWDGTTASSCPVSGACVFSITDRLFSGITTLLANDFFYNTGSPSQNALPPGQQIAQRTLTFATATSMDMTEQLILEVQAFGFPSSAFSADFSHSGHLFIDPVSAGASYTTASGNLFLSPSAPVTSVPEPASTWSLMAGLGGLGVFAVRRRLQQSDGRTR